MALEKNNPLCHHQSGFPLRKEKKRKKKSAGKEKNQLPKSPSVYWEMNLINVWVGWFVSFKCTALHPGYFFNFMVFIWYFNLWKCVFCATLTTKAPDLQVNCIPFSFNTKQRTDFRIWLSLYINTTQLVTWSYGM